MRMIYLPNMPNVNMSRGHKQRQGRGMGSVLLGGVGSASSYESVDDYLETTGRKMGGDLFPSGKGLSLFSAGAGLHPMSAGGIGLGIDRRGLNKKLESLSVAPKKSKAKNIRFNL